jgi:hypothetical protein
MLRGATLLGPAAVVAMVLVSCGGDSTVGDVREDPLEVGEDYGYSLVTHCGIEWARIGGAWWRTAPLSDGNANPPAGWGNPSQGGRLRIESDTTAVFTGGPEPITFERTEITAIDDPALPDSARFCD